MIVTVTSRRLVVSYLDVRVSDITSAKLPATALLLAVLVELGTSERGDMSSVERE